MSDEGSPEGLPARLLTDLKRAASALMRARSVDVITHIDADGITAGAIAAETLRRLGKTYTLTFEKKITEETVDKVNRDPSDYVWICDLGSAYMGQFTRSGIVVTDHHVPDTKWRSGQSMLDAFSASYQLNPHLYGASGSYEVSGAGMTYLLSRAIDPKNVDLAYLAVIGAIGDFQDSRESRLVGWNRVILQDAVDCGDMEVSYGIRFFGRGTRPLVQFLQYGEPAIPGLASDADACYNLLAACQVPANNPDGTRRTWCDLDPVECAMLTDELVSRARNDEDRAALLGELYTVKRYDFKTGLGDAKEFATTLNSCGRYDDADTGAKICLGDLDALKEADGEIQTRFSPELAAKAADYMDYLTQGRYDGVALTRDFAASAKRADDLLPRSASYLSAGAADLLYLSVRLAMCAMTLTGDDPCPIILDDMLVNFDDGRAKRAMELFYEISRERQVILFTCHKRDYPDAVVDANII